ncbi:hypothetical protein DFR27_0752 [Umboniibacter marinipuniceus]|uniref:Uncharacterized protein n=1 Tax=Umboniibacter marinipuniceus TaxID=569599 RepID=A0A3M0APL8_9GAMM|nr:hypothetical protein DFR27_0752 [Umboniibacter marinipuniceus]
MALLIAVLNSALGDARNGAVTFSTYYTTAICAVFLFDSTGGPKLPGGRKEKQVAGRLCFSSILIGVHFFPGLVLFTRTCVDAAKGN